MFALLKTFRPDLAPPLVDVTAAAMALRRINKVRTQRPRLGCASYSEHSSARVLDLGRL